MASNYVEWYFQLYDLRLNRPIDDDSGKVQVLTAGSYAKATIYSDDSGTSATNPVTLTNGVIRFFTDASVTSLDLSVLTANGHALFLPSMSTSLHRINVDPDKAEQVAKIGIVATASGTLVDTGMKLPRACMVHDAYLKVEAASSGAAVDAGTSTAATGFLVGVTAEATGVRPVDESASVGTAGGKGTLLRTAATATLMNCLNKYVPANATSGVSIVYQNTTAASVGGGYVFLRFTRMLT